VQTRAWITEEAARLGFRHLRVARLAPGSDPCPRLERLDAWLDAGRHADMGWMVSGREVRADPRLRGAALRSAVVLALEHHHRRPPDPGGLTGMVARYAWGRDYHNLVGKRLRRLLRRLREGGLGCWGGVDTAPIFERAWAAEAGLGFTGKNAVQIWPARGSWMFLAVIFTEAELPPDAPLGDHCGRCRRCLDACPTDAFRGPYQLDARACVAYWTIEARGPIPPALRPGFGRWVFGCDVCQEVCPHNAAPPDAEEADLAPRNAWLDLEWLLGASDEAILERFEGTPLRRPGPDGLRRNACVVLGNLGDPAAGPALLRAARRGGVVGEHARWALEKVGR
jgi:epoxyqueuosine reductase